MQEQIEPGDRQLGELLRSLQLLEAETLTTLLNEAKRTRRSLRQLLLAGSYLTLYQIALIETGNLDSLVLGPLRIIDRLGVTPREAVYRVFDPRHGREAILRHLAEEEMHDAVHPDEFRQRFAQAAAIQHPHVAAIHEVLDLKDRPAVLQEWLVGLPSQDWPGLAAVPGVWYRLVNQAATALAAIHEAGLVHGHMSAANWLLSETGQLKLCGLGEPPWLPMAPTIHSEKDQTTDLADFGKIAAEWHALAARQRGVRIRPLPAALQPILERLQVEQQESRYPSARDLLADLEQAGANLSANAVAWDRLLAHVREHAGEHQPLARSA